VLYVSYGASVLELSLLGLETVADVFVVAVLDVAFFDLAHVVGVLFWEDFGVLDGLDGGVVMVLVDFAVDDLGCVLMLGAGYVFVCDGWVDGLGSLVSW